MELPPKLPDETVKALRNTRIQGVPINLRPPGSEHELGNRFGIIAVELPVGHDDPLERLDGNGGLGQSRRRGILQ